MGALEQPVDQTLIRRSRPSSEPVLSPIKAFDLDQAKAILAFLAYIKETMLLEREGVTDEWKTLQRRMRRLRAIVGE